MRDFSNQYLHLLKNDYAGINLTRILDEENFYNLQILDSVLPADQSESFKQSLNLSYAAVDLGFGGGFPILPLAKRFLEKKFIGFEARGKKVSVVTQIALKLGLGNVKLVHERFENLLFDKNFLITAKAVSTISDILSQIVASNKVQVFFYKGPAVFTAEKIEFEKWKMIENQEILVPGTEKRYLIGYENKDVLRGTNKNLVKVSSFL